MKGLYAYHAKHERLLDVKNIQHGFVPNRNCVTAATQHIGFNYTIIMDLKDFFDTCNVNHFPKSITRYSHLFHEQGHCAQGFASSPILCNIASLNMVRQIKENLISLHNKYKLTQEHSEPGVNKYPFAFTIYADDIQISTNYSSLISTIIHNVDHFAVNNGFIINRNKTRVRTSIAGYRRILGINVGLDHIRATRKTIRKIRAADHQGNYHSKAGLITWSLCKFPKQFMKINQ